MAAETAALCHQDVVAPPNARRVRRARLQRRLARVCADPWMLATGEDYRFDGVEGGSRTIGTRMMHRYLDRVVRLTTERADVRQVVLDVFHMMRRPGALFHHRILIPALRAREHRKDISITTIDSGARANKWKEASHRK